MTIQDAVAYIEATDGRIFSVEVKKRDGEVRVMNCRLKVTKHLAGGERSYDPRAKNLIFVFDMHKNGYRSIAIEGIRRISINGQWVEVTHPQDSKGK